ncbi:hypothetical protein QYF36_003691 [Acer negundo]|nr:hypothetical protein QYF36_003691 [Acer negundo]
MMLWQELDLLQNFNIEEPEEVATLAEMLEWERVFDFLASLRPEFHEGEGEKLENLPYLSKTKPVATILLGLLEFIQVEHDIRGQLENENQGRMLDNQSGGESVHEQQFATTLDFEEGNKEMEKTPLVL